MAALVQSFPSPTASTMTMLQSRPASSEAFQGASQGHQHQRNPQMPKNIYNTSVGGMATGNYRGHASTAPVSPYAFSNTPIIQAANPLRQHPTTPPHPRLENRTASAPSVPVAYSASSQVGGSTNWPRPTPVNAVSPALLGQNSHAPQQNTSKDDITVSPHANKQPPLRPLSTIDLNSPSLPMPSYANVAKSSPDRYRRNHRRAETSAPLPTASTQGGSALPSGSGMVTVGHLYTHPNQTNSTPSLSTYPHYRGAQPINPTNATDLTSTIQLRPTSKDDSTLSRPSPDLAKRYRRRSISSLEAKEYAIPMSEPATQLPARPKSYAATLASPAPSEQREIRSTATSEQPSTTFQRPTSTFERPTVSHGRAGSTDSVNSNQSGSKMSSAKHGPEVATNTATAQQATPVTKNEAKVVNVPPRESSNTNKRLTNPSPLSKPLSMSPDLPSPQESSTPTSAPKVNTPNVAIPESPAAQQLAALTKKDGKKEAKSSRLRRAFSFGSSAELRKASAENSAAHASNERAKLRKDRYQNEEEAQQAAIAQRQEAAGLGEGIYSGQGNFFTGSTDNLSISSTASSASVMIRKMGKGVKKGSRSLVGLFRPKSVVGVPAADSAVPEPSVAQVSMVTVEAEREKVNVNANPHDQTGGGTGYPKLERNSMDAANMAYEPAHSFSDDSVRGRRSIVGGEKERAEVLAAVKKGILKRSGSSSPVVRPVDSKNPGFTLPNIPRFNESPHVSGPNTPTDEVAPRGHGRGDSVHIEGEEYFLSLQNFANGQSTSVPGTPRSIARNISFNPRIQFHDTWPSGEYDRRGEIATCNRLTPMLAQQIKEELNTFKMEMDVHADSKVFTHFF